MIEPHLDLKLYGRIIDKQITKVFSLKQSKSGIDDWKFYSTVYFSLEQTNPNNPS